MRRAWGRDGRSGSNGWPGVGRLHGVRVPVILRTDDGTSASHPLVSNGVVCVCRWCTRLRSTTQCGQTIWDLILRRRQKERRRGCRRVAADGVHDREAAGDAAADCLSHDGESSTTGFVVMREGQTGRRRIEQRREAHGRHWLSKNPPLVRILPPIHVHPSQARALGHPYRRRARAADPWQHRPPSCLSLSLSASRRQFRSSH